MAIGLDELKEIYANAGGQSITAADMVRLIDSVPITSTEQIEASVKFLLTEIYVQSVQINNLNRLIGKLIFELVEQGIKIQNKELINQLEIYGYSGKK